MTPLVVVLVVVALVVIVALAATNPLMRRREDEAIAGVKAQLGAVELIEPRTTAMGTEPEEAGGVRGMVCLGLSDAELMALTWARGHAWRIPRASVRSVDSPADDPGAVPKATITITYVRPDGDEATAMFRLRDAADWLDALGWDDAGGAATATAAADAASHDDGPADDDLSGADGSAGAGDAPAASDILRERDD
jgi:hypothetical protein